MTAKSQGFKAVVKACLVLSSAASFRVCFTPPNGPPKCLPPKPSLRGGFTPEMRDWIIVFLTIYALPLEMMMYDLVSLNEVLQIMSLAFPSLPIQPFFPLHLSNSGPGIPAFVLFGSLLSIAGCILKMACFRRLAGFTFEVSKSPELATTGPYSIVRHPAYTATWMNFIGSVMVHWWILGTGLKPFGYAWLVGVGSGITVLLTRMGDEDVLMKKLFGSQWETWRKVVRYSLIPGVY
ncbi:hypothetical protein L218DRAFT_1081380 [Marasmius fiardii PR-910]|nr:hypothetical protein L218DRAFT_1081380 [Marasmius fiardii PR-910]